MSNLVTNALAQNVNFVTKFERDLHNLLALLGKSDVEKLSPGTALVTYTTSGTLASGTVAEKALIPDSEITTGDGVTKVLAYKKYRNLTSIEKIGKIGYDLAVGKTNDKILGDVQKGIRTDLIGALAVSGSTNITVPAATATFQMKVSKAVGKVAALFEDEACTPIAFANTEDAFDYLGSATITVQTAFGISYIANFMGIATVILDSNVPSGTVYATAAENLEVVAASVEEIPDLDMYTDETGIIAVHTGAKYENGAVETVVFSGTSIYAAVADRVVKVTTAA